MQYVHARYLIKNSGEWAYDKKNRIKLKNGEKRARKKYVTEIGGVALIIKYSTNII